VRILAIDAATEACSVALLDGEQIIERSGEAGKTQSQQILRLVQELLDEAGLSLTGLDALAASIGPGGFTGVRITVAVAQGLAYGANLPAIGITTLEALALQVLREPDTQALACLDARMGELYWGCFRLLAGEVIATRPARVGSPSSVQMEPEVSYVGVGRGFRAYPALAQLDGVRVDAVSVEALPRAREVARLAALRYPLHRNADPADLQPVYLRDKVALTEAERSHLGGR
jgi:tRNA threonylcarbamoyladenosine biosynthesis protein TsaB